MYKIYYLTNCIKDKLYSNFTADVAININKHTVAVYLLM